jgi:hypothetical protein
MNSAQGQCEFERELWEYKETRALLDTVSWDPK